MTPASRLSSTAYAAAWRRKKLFLSVAILAQLGRRPVYWRTGRARLPKWIATCSHRCGLAFLAVIMATWTTNASNLYSGSLMLATLFTKVRRWKLTVAAGAIGVGISSLGIIDHFISFLLVLGIAIPPIGAIYVADYFFIRRRQYDVALLETVPRANVYAFVAWFAGLAAGFATASDHIRLSGVPSIDAMAVALLTYLALSVSMQKMRAKAAS